MSAEPLWRFIKSTDRSTAPSSSPPPTEAIAELCGPLPGLRKLSRDELAAVYPLLLLGRGFVPPRQVHQHSLRESSPAFSANLERQAHRKRLSRRRRASRAFASPLDELAQCAADERAAQSYSELAEKTSNAGLCEQHGHALPSSPPAEPAFEISFSRNASVHGIRPDSASSLPSPPPSPRVEDRPVCPMAHKTISASKRARVCIACGSRQTPCWRPSWDPQRGQLCNSCGLRFRKSRARCVTPGCLRIPARTELAEARASVAAGNSIRCKNCAGALLFYAE